MKKHLLLAIILTEGFVSIATEIITIRQLLPAVGSSVVVTSFIIGVFLLALAYGYKHGGYYKNNLAQILQRNFIIASALLGLGLSSSFILLFFHHVQQRLLPNDLAALLLYLTMITVPLVFLLGQTVPITMNLIGKSASAGLIGSKVLHLSTLGSFLGSVLTTILFMNYFGVAWTILINTTLLLLLSLAMVYHTTAQQRSLLALVLLLPCVYWLNIKTDTNAITSNNAYSNYHIIAAEVAGKPGKIFAINNSASSFAADTTLAGFKYIEIIKDILHTQLQLQHKEILVLGAGGFSLSAAGDHGNRFIYVDIDPDLPEIATGKFIPKINGEFIAADARVFLRTHDNKYDVIISDVFSGKIAIPAHLVTQQYFQSVAAHLQQNGVAIFNVIINPQLRDAYSQTTDNTIRTVFHSCMTIPVNYAAVVSNVLYVCNNAATPRSLAIYSDNFNRSNLEVAVISNL